MRNGNKGIFDLFADYGRLDISYSCGSVCGCQKKIKNRFINSFLYYIPYTVLAAMTFPSALYATGHIFSAAMGLCAAILVSLKNKNLTVVAVTACLFVLLAEGILMLI